MLVIRDQELTPEGFKKAAQVFGQLQQHDKKGDACSGASGRGITSPTTRS